MTRIAFKALVKQLSGNGYHIIYSLRAGWCYVSYKSERVKIHIGMTDQQATDRLWGMLPITKKIIERTTN